MKTPKGKEVFVFDYPETFDRFTILLKDGSLFGASAMPFNPLGFGQYCGECKRLNGPYIEYNNVTGYLKDAREDPSWMGKETTLFSELPEDVQKYVEQVSE